MSARLYPSDYSSLQLEGVAARELDVLKRLANGLGDDYVIYHGIHWSRLEQGLTVTGRIQFLILSPAGVLVLMSMKTGLMKQEGGVLSKTLDNQQVDVFNELWSQRDRLLDKFKPLHTKPLCIEPIFYCPDYKLQGEGGLAMQETRVVDATKKNDLLQILKGFDEQVRAQAANFCLDKPLIERFLRNAFGLVPEVGVVSAMSEQWVTRLVQGLEQWVARLSFKPFRLRVLGTAGSGKSQLAWHEVQANHANKFRSLYVCYNRPLASHFARRVRAEGLHGAFIFNFHALCDRVLKEAGVHVDYSVVGVFDTLAEQVLNLPQDKRWQFDSIVVDEGQDFDKSWLDVLQKFAHPATRWIWLEDPSQNLYNKAQLDFPDWVQLTVNVNYRNPVHIVDALMRYRHLFALNNAADFEVKAACPLEGFPIEYLAYENDEGLFTQTSKAITLCLKHGFTRDHIVVLSMRGHEKSKILKQISLGPHTLRHFTGRYDEQGNQLFTDGAVLAESVYRFKGQSAQAVVITELEFENWSEKEFKKLFVAMTRSKMFLVFVGLNDSVGRLVDSCDF